MLSLPPLPVCPILPPKIPRCPMLSSLLSALLLLISSNSQGMQSVRSYTVSDSRSHLGREISFNLCFLVNEKKGRKYGEVKFQLFRLGGFTLCWLKALKQWLSACQASCISAVSTRSHNTIKTQLRSSSGILSWLGVTTT